MNDDNTTLSLAGLFAMLGLLAVGGGNGVFPEMHRQTVELHHWLTATQFSDMFAIARASPGPNILIVTLIGWHVGGLLGAFVATAALCGPSGVLAYVVSRVWHQMRETRWRRAMQVGLAPVTVGLTFASSYVLTRAADQSLASYAITAGTAVIALTTRLNPLWIFLGVGIAGAAGLL